MTPIALSCTTHKRGQTDGRTDGKLPSLLSSRLTVDKNVATNTLSKYPNTRPRIRFVYGVRFVFPVVYKHVHFHWACKHACLHPDQLTNGCSNYQTFFSPNSAQFYSKIMFQSFPNQFNVSFVDLQSMAG